MTAMSIHQRALDGIVWSAVQIWGSRAIGFVVFLILSRLLDPKAFGLLALASVFVAFVQIFVEQGMADAIVQRKELEYQHLDTAFWTSILMGGVLTVVGFTASGYVALFFSEPELEPILRWLSLGFLFAALSGTQQAILRRQLAFKELAIRSLLVATTGGAVGVVMAFRGFGVWSLVGQILTNGLAGAVVLWRVSSWRPGFGLSRKHFAELFVFGLKVVGSQLLNIANRRSDDLLIGYFLGPTALGYYTIAYRVLTEMTGLLTSVTSAVAFPVFSRLQGDPRRLRAGFYAAVKFTSLFAFPAFFGLSIVAPELVTAVFGPKWAPSIPVMQALVFIGVLHSTLFFCDNVVLAAGKPSWVLGMTLLNAISNVIVFAIAIRWGIVAVAVAYVIRGYLLSPIPIWAVRQLIEIRITTYLRLYFVPLVGSLFAVTTVLALKPVVGDVLGLHLRLCIYVLVGGLAYLLTIQVLAPSLYGQIIELIRLTLPSLRLRRT